MGDVSGLGKPQRVFCVLNPRAATFHQARAALREGCRKAGWPDPVFLTTTRAEPGGPQARLALTEGADLVVAAGGDGTVREVAHVLAGTGTPLGILPIGTANLTALNLGIDTRRLGRAVKIALHSPTRAIDVGRATWRPTSGDVTEHTFLVMAGLGNDAATVLAVRPEFKRRLGKASYLAAGARKLRSRVIGMKVSVDGGPSRDLRTWTLLVGNAGRIAPGVHVFPDAEPDDGVLDTLVVPLRNVVQWLPVALTGIGLLRKASALSYGRARQVWAIPDAPAPVHLDGDVVEDVVDLRVDIVPGALAVRAPTKQTTPTKETA